jgi:hypothetical protein
MKNVIALHEYRKKQRKTFLLKHKAQLERFIARFIDQHLDMDLLRLTYERVSDNFGSQEESWDYVEFREILADAIDQAIGLELYLLLKQQSWFDHRLIGRDEIVERCLSDYILSQCHVATYR